uniref:Uncharacterized protein n=1 Tax=Oryza rufipogon TaxID=4529 RepID=A0A0E0Q8S7_ORYRU
MAVATWWWTTTAAVYCNATTASSYLPVVCRALATPTRLAPDADPLSLLLFLNDITGHMRAFDKGSKMTCPAQMLSP